jgi:hypothetical protein
MRTALLVLAGADLRAVLPEAGHVSNLEQQEAFDDAVRAVLPPPRGARRH